MTDYDIDDACGCCGDPDCDPCEDCGGCTTCLNCSGTVTEGVGPESDTYLCRRCSDEEPITADDLRRLATLMRLDERAQL